MCEIFFAMATEGKTLDINTLWEIAGEALYSSIGNPDGWGAFNQDRKVMKAPGFFVHEDAREFVRAYEGSEWVVLHLRFATSGDLNSKNTHPYTMRGVTVVHNGIADVDGIDPGSRWDSPKTRKRKGFWAKRSDTWAMLHAIVGAPGETTEEKIERAFDGMDGSFSVFLMDDDHDLFYFRDLSSFTFMELADDGLILGATRRDALEAMTWGDSPFTTPRPRFITPEAEVIYALTPWEGLTAIGKFANAGQWSTYTYGHDSYGYGGNYTSPYKPSSAAATPSTFIDLTGPEPRQDREALDEWLFLQKHYGDAPDENGGEYDPEAVALAELNADREAEYMARYEATNRRIAAAAKLTTPGDEHKRIMADAAEAERKAEHERSVTAVDKGIAYGEAMRKEAALREIADLEIIREHSSSGELTRSESDRELEAMRNLFGEPDPAVTRWVQEERDFERAVDARAVDERGKRELLDMLPAAPLFKPSTRTLEIWQRLDDFMARRRWSL